MRSRLVDLLPLCFLLGFSISTFAGKFSYQCVVVEERHLSDDGTMSPYRQPLALGKRFAVDRRSGALIAPDMALWTFDNAQVAVLARGNKDASFVVTYVAPAAGGGVNETLINVREFVDGTKKPFVVVSAASVYSGTCE